MKIYWIKAQAPRRVLALAKGDFQLASMATYWREAEMPMQSYAHIVAWIGELQRLPAWYDPWPAATQRSC